MATRSIIKAEQKLFISAAETVPVVELAEIDHGHKSTVLLLSRKRSRKESAKSLLQSIALSEASALARASERRLDAIRARHDDAQDFDAKRVKSAIQVNKMTETTPNALAKNVTSIDVDGKSGVTSSSLLESSSSSSCSSSSSSSQLKD